MSRTYVDEDLGNGCTKTSVYDNGHLLAETWTNEDGELSRNNGPAEIYYEIRPSKSNSNVQLLIKTREIYFNNGMIHRDGGPAVITFDRQNFQIQSEEWYHYNKQHRIDGPAIIFYYNEFLQPIDDDVVWFIDGKRIYNPPSHWPLNEEEQIELKLRCL